LPDETRDNVITTTGREAHDKTNWPGGKFGRPCQARWRNWKRGRGGGEAQKMAAQKLQDNPLGT
jgi:hypothetical protein